MPNKEISNKRRKAGLCTRCGKVREDKTKANCLLCRFKDRNRKDLNLKQWIKYIKEREEVIERNRRKGLTNSHKKKKGLSKIQKEEIKKSERFIKQMKKLRLIKNGRI